MGEITLNEKFKPLFTSKKRYFVITGGRGSGKSFATTLFDCLKTYEKGHKTLYTRYTLTSAEISIIPEYSDKIELINKLSDFDINSKEITNKATESSILFRGIKTSSGNQTANLKSIEGITTWILDEAEELIDEKIFDKIDESIRTKTQQNRVILILNPTSKKHWIWNRFFEGNFEYTNIDGFDIQISTHPDVEHIHVTYLDNYLNLSESFINKILKLKEKKPEQYKHRILGAWIEEPEGVLFKISELYRFELKELNNNYIGTIAFCDVADQGSDYLCFLVARVYDNFIYIIDCVYTKETSEITKPLIMNMIEKHNINTAIFESNNMGAQYGKDIRNRLKDINSKCMIRLMSQSSNKKTRILMLSEHITEYFYFRSDIDIKSQYYSYLNDLTGYLKEDKNEHDDAPDATAGLAQFVFNVYARQKGLKFNLKTIN